MGWLCETSRRAVTVQLSWFTSARVGKLDISKPQSLVTVYGIKTRPDLDVYSWKSHYVQYVYTVYVSTACCCILVSLHTELRLCTLTLQRDSVER